MIIKKINEEFTIQLDTHKTLFNNQNNFELHYFTENSNELLKFDSIFIEILSNIQNKKSFLISIPFIGENKIIIEENHLFLVGDLIIINNDFFIIKEIKDSTLILDRKILISYPENTEIFEKPNTGIYQTKISITDPGKYMFVIKDIITNKNSSIFTVEIVEKSIDDKLNSIQDSLNNEFTSFV